MECKNNDVRRMDVVPPLVFTCAHNTYCYYRYILYIEAAANGMFGVGHKGMINPPDEKRQFHLNMAEIAVFDQEVYDLIMDLTLIIDMAKVC